jgi:predicted TIM-barrel fold metal-dependent hydrolase
MWIQKWKRDEMKGVHSPMPTQVVSNEEFIPRPQSKKQAQVERVIGEMAEEKSKKLGMDRRAFMSSSMGLATCFLAANKVYGNYWDVDEEETLDKAAYEEKWPKSEYFIIDVQTHFADLPNLPGGMAMLPFRNMEWVRNMGIKLENKPDSYSFQNFVKEIFMDSETSMCVISGVPGREIDKDAKGNTLEGEKRKGGILPSWLMAKSRDQINNMAGSQRALSQGNCAPNHYWDKKNNKPDFVQLFEQMDREVKQYGIGSWKWYCHFDPGRSGSGFRLDDEKMTYPALEHSRKLGLKIVSCHKGYSAQSRTLGHFAHPGDVEKAALDNPDFTWIVYHSALKHGPSEPDFDKGTIFDPTTGDLAWHSDLMKMKERNPNMNNVYPEIGSAFGTLAIVHPEMCMHFLGRNIKMYGSDHVIWGTDCLWWGSPQWVIDAFKRFQISDELCEKFGYTKLTKEDKAKIFGLNAAKIYGVNVEEKRTNLPKDALEKAKLAYQAGGGMPDLAAFGWVRADA